MQRYFALNEQLELDVSDIHHITKVMRMKIGDKINIIYDQTIYLCQINELNTNNIKFDILSKIENETKSLVKVTIAISLVSEQKWDYILQKSTELGVSEIIPLELSRTLVKVDDKKMVNKKDRWLKICKEAAEQSHRLSIPTITNSKNIKNLLKGEYDLKIVCSTGINVLNIKQILQKNKSCGKILVVVGPEGGITDSEETILEENNFVKGSLGDLILRVETAPLFILSAINYEWMR